MTAQEFIQWAAYLRRAPALSGRWINLQFAELKREIAKGHRYADGKLPGLDKFAWKPPEPLFVGRKRAEAKQRREVKANS